MDFRGEFHLQGCKFRLPLSASEILDKNLVFLLSIPKCPTDSSVLGCSLISLIVNSALLSLAGNDHLKEKH